MGYLRRKGGKGERHYSIRPRARGPDGRNWLAADRVLCGWLGKRKGGRPSTERCRFNGLMTTEILINRYKVLERLGEGAMGAVWLVEDSTSQQILAMKVLSQQMGDSEKSFLQLKQEFRLMTQLRHPNCCAVYDYGQLPE